MPVMSNKDNKMDIDIKLPSPRYGIVSLNDLLSFLEDDTIVNPFIHMVKQEMNIESNPDTYSEVFLKDYLATHGEKAIIKETSMAETHSNNIQVSHKAGENQSEDMELEVMSLECNIDLDQILSRYRICNTEIMGLEGHFKWLLEFKVEPDKIVDLKKKMVSWLDESKEVSKLSYCQEITQHLLIALYDTLLGNFTNAFEHSNKAKQIIEQALLENEPLEHINVYAYILWTDQVNILWRMNKEIPIFEEEIHELLTNAKSRDITSSECAAAMLALKGHFAIQLGLSDYFHSSFKKIARFV